MKFQRCAEKAQNFLFMKFAKCFICQIQSVEFGPACFNCYGNWNIQRKSKSVTLAGNVKLNTLWDWKRGDYSVYDLIEKQKNGFPPISNWCAENLVLKYVSELEGQEVVFVPVPATDAGAQDHAFLLARFLAEKTGGKFEPVLRKASNQRVKKSRREDRRSRIQVLLNENISRNSLVVLVDDVYTTGATAEACFTALGSPTNFQIWALVHRLLDDA